MSNILFVHYTTLQYKHNIGTLLWNIKYISYCKKNYWHERCKERNDNL